jgi:hypothetical protein
LAKPHAAIRRYEDGFGFHVVEPEQEAVRHGQSGAKVGQTGERRDESGGAGDGLREKQDRKQAKTVCDRDAIKHHPVWVYDEENGRWVEERGRGYNVKTSLEEETEGDRFGWDYEGEDEDEEDEVEVDVKEIEAK